MAELALAVVGVVPLVGGAIKAYKEVNGKLKLFRHHSKEVKKVHKVLKIQRQVFANECRLWLGLVIDDDEVASEMASDSDHEGWNDFRLDASFRSQLNDNYEAWFEITKDISESISDIELAVERFEIVPETRSKHQDGQIKRTLKKTHEGLKVAFKSSDFDKSLESLRSSNHDLKGLREQISKYHKPRMHVSIRTKTSKGGNWKNPVRIRQVSKALYEALVRTWNCSQPGHMGHTMKLFVETHRVNEQVQMNMAILEVRSQHLGWIRELQPVGQLSSPENWPPTSQRPLEVVRLAETTAHTSIKATEHPSLDSSDQAATFDFSDLGTSKDICRDLTRQLSATCLGYIDSRLEEAFRYSFYPVENNISGAVKSSSAKHKAIVSVDEVLDERSGDFLSTVDRLKLARSLVSAVLNFHSTPWLNEFWRLRDLAFFRMSQGEEVADVLRTLHMGVEVSQRTIGSVECVENATNCPNTCQVTEDERLSRGIDNLTLYSLGVALLQIDRWANIEPSDVLTVRKTALRPSLLGLRYQSITQKCLRCDFGCGSDLTKPGLQEAVYEHVVGALEAMISSLDFSED
ncbi:hypothetical protein CCHL11_02467 [Colletotrichum chlorophyti]|uniref:DUF7580 domain-containing protein n=1 Tax=Colletotrichum chlorophyti TaxID=708187 RepID=A0A1Q8S622_9PEZI|nr:hypothetical protein CCHL11_02467 [Colletotrichum chlorophyti]